MKSELQKGWICLDIDGTITDKIKEIPSEVLAYLKKLHQKDWNIVFVTGRTFSLAHTPLKEFDVPYFLVPQNGASAFEMPSQKMLIKKYLPLDLFQDLEKLLNQKSLDIVLFTGIDQGEHVFYRPSRLSGEVLNYFEKSLTQLAGKWKAVESFYDLPIQEFPYGKIYGSRQQLLTIAPTFSKIPSIKTHLVYDSVNPDFSILQIMRQDVDKGKAVLEIIGPDTLPQKIISAGNDNNDEALLQIADVKIAIKGSPQCLLDQATIIAPPVADMGIIPALELAVEKLRDVS